jgi:hypothetical protein
MEEVKELIDDTQATKFKKREIGIRFKSDDGESEDSKSSDQNSEKEKSLDDTISERTQSLGHIEAKRHIKNLIPYVRLPLIDRKKLITEIRESKFFSDDAIFEAIMYQDVPENIDNINEKRFRRRGFKLEFDNVHDHIEVTQSNIQKKISTLLKRTRNSEFSASRYVTATHSEPLPLHGIHYIEIKLKYATFLRSC